MLLNTITSAISDILRFRSRLLTTTTQGIGSGSATFARATAAKCVDFENILRTAKSGEIRFESQRRVENKVLVSENINGSGWSSAGTQTGDTVVLPVSGTSARYNTPTLNPEGGAGTYVFMMYVPAAIYWSHPDNPMKMSHAGLDAAKVNFTANSVNGGAGGWITFKYTTAGSSTDFRLENLAGGTTVTVTQKLKFQIEDVTGQANQNPGEYISCGVLSAPYHGVNVDGVKYFTNENGNTVSSNIVTEANGVAISDSVIKGVMIEKASENKIVGSEATTGWITDSSTTVASGTSSNNLSFIKVTETAILGAHCAYKSATYTGSYACVSAFVKKGTRRYIGLSIYTNTYAILQQFLFDLDTGTFVSLGTPVGTPTGIAYGIQLVSPGVYRVWAKINHTTGTVASACFFLSNSSNPTWWGTGAYYTGDTNEYGYFSGMQLEDSIYPTSYLKTTAAAVTRNKDELYYPVSGNIDANNGAIEFYFTPSHAATGTVVLFGCYVDADNYTQLLNDETNLIFRKRISGTNYDATIANAFAANTTYHVRATWSATNGTSISLNGVTGTGNSNTAALQLGTNFYIGSDGQGNNQFGGNIKDFRIA